MTTTNNTSEQTIVSVELATLQNVPFTIISITNEPQLNDEYHFFKWRFTVLSQTGRYYSFLLNPSKKRNQNIALWQTSLPLQNMTLARKEFIEQKTYKNVVYYDVVDYKPVMGAITH